MEARKAARSLKPALWARVGHLGGDAGDFVEAEGVDLVGREVGGGAAEDVVLVALCAVGQRGDGEGGAAVRGVVRGDEGGEGAVGGDDVLVDGVGDLGGEALLVFSGDAGGVLLRWDEEGVGVDDAVALAGDFFEQEADGHEVVFHAGAEDLGGLGEDAGNLVEARDVVLVVLDGVEGHAERKVGEAGVDAVHLVDGHLVLFEVVVVEALLEDAGEEVVGEEVLLGEAGGGDGLEAGEVGDVGGVAAGDGAEGAVGELVVVAIVSVGGGALGGFFEVGLVELFEESVLGGEAGVDGGGLGGEGVRGGDGEARGKEQGQRAVSA